MYDAQKAAKILLEYTRYKGYGYVYHYTGDDSADNILTSTGVDFWETNINDFSDKTEGKAFGQFYISALERLLYEKVIGFEAFYILSSVKPMETHPFYVENIINYINARSEKRKFVNRQYCLLTAVLTI